MRDDFTESTKRLIAAKVGGDIQNGLFMRMEKALQADEDTMFLNPKEIAA